MSRWVEVTARPEFETPLSLDGFSEVRRSRVYYLQAPDLDKILEGLQRDSRCLADPVSEQLEVDGRADSGHDWVVEVTYRGGVTDNEARVVEEVLPVQARSARRYYLRGGNAAQIEALAARHWANSLIQRIQVVPVGQPLASPPPVLLGASPPTEVVELPPGRAELEELSRKRLLALTGEEMEIIAAHFASLGRNPTEVELEALAQTWSEHCKHKIFNDNIEFEGEVIQSLFKTYIAGSTARCKRDWLVSIFSDNAGVIEWNERYHLVFKVETHNAPSALEPYGGALTGIVGVNRDPAGTGLGADLIFNTDVFCFAPLNWDGPIPEGLHSPRRLYEGVRQGVEDGGNQSGIPTVNGALFFDPRYLGRPLVFCGTGALMERQTRGQPTHLKSINPGDLVVMAGGRVGKDGIHGATFSSLAIGGGEAPVGVVQIGDPMTQKRLLEMLGEARQQGLYRAVTDNGAGGLCSSVGELAQMSGGAHLDLEQVPLKYPGLAAWEILVSESQERMTLVVEPAHWEALQAMAQLFAVELSDIGIFTDTGTLDVQWAGKSVAVLDMEFLHEGTPQKYLHAVAPTPQLQPAQLPANIDYNETILQLLAAWNICSREPIIRRYDHEVKGKTIVKPLMGRQGKAPQDAAVVRLHFDTHEGIAVSNGILPRYGDINAYEMSAGAFDEAMRQIIAVGGSLPNTKENDDIFWSVNDNFCVPDSVYDPVTNPDGKEKLGKLVQMCQALYDMSTFFDIPLTSGKDSMKNDFKSEGKKISVPPTILYSMTAKMPDVRRVVTSDFKQAGDAIYQIGRSYEELGASEFYALHKHLGERLPIVRKEAAKALYLQMMQAHSQRIFASVHDLSDGGLAVALAESCFGGNVGASVELPQSLFADGTLSTEGALFGESHSRFVVSVAAERAAELEAIFGENAFYLGTVGGERLHISRNSQTLVEQPVGALLDAWQSRSF